MVNSENEESLTFYYWKFNKMKIHTKTKGVFFFFFFSFEKMVTVELSFSKSVPLNKTLNLISI